MMTGEKRKSEHLARGQPESPTGAPSPAEDEHPESQIIWLEPEDDTSGVIIMGGAEHHPAAKGKKKGSGERPEPDGSDKGT
jgi:hypothetical protein